MISPAKDPRIRVAGILLKGDEILLIAHKKNGDIYWLLPGGGVDYGESLEEALVREFQEELNITVNVNDVAIISDSIDPSGERHVVNICFYCTHAGGDFSLGDDKRLHDFRFFKDAEIENIDIFPPINKNLKSIIGGNSGMKYIGKLWK